MVLIDSDVFVLDLFYPDDPRTAANSRFIDLEMPEVSTTIFNVLEVCGIASFSRTAEQVEALFHEFHQIYGLRILYPDWESPSAGDLVRRLVARTFDRILLKMDFSDALILSTAESAGGEVLVTWNIRHFEGRTSLRVVTPEAF